MNAKHTPGPWHILPRNRVSKAGVSTFDIMSGNGNPENWDMIAGRVDGEANARLIAAAPHLKDALYYLGGGSVYLEQFERLCYCPRHGAGDRDKHSTACNDAWDAYQEANHE